MNKILTSTVFLLLVCVTCFGQSAYKGLTPGKSTRADVERVLGRPVKAVSVRLIEYKESDVDKIYVQYRDASPAAIVDRIELVCDYLGKKDQPDGCANLNSRLLDAAVKGRKFAHIVERESSGHLKTTHYDGPPILRVSTLRYNGEESVQFRLGLYSADLFDSVVPKNCTGTFLGEWETNRGRLILTDIQGTNGGDGDIPNTKGTYSMNNGTVTGRAGQFLTGEWKDATGTGTFELKIDWGSPFVPTWPDPRKVFTGVWRRTSGRGPKEGKWEGRCVETNGGTN